MDAAKNNLNTAESRYLLPLAILAFGVGLLVTAGFFLSGGVWGVLAPEALEVGEPFIVSAAYNAGIGGRLYAPIQSLPFLHNNYHPLVQWLIAPVLARTGPSYVPMRVLTLVSALGILVVLGLIVRRATGRFVSAFLAALLPLSCTFVFPWLCLGRVDVFATLFSLLAVAWAYCHREHSAARRLAWIVFAWIAFAAKQTMIGGAAAILIEALLSRRFKEAFVGGSIYLAGALAFVGGAALLTDGESWRHAIVFNAEHDRGGIWPGGLRPSELAFAIGPAILIGLAGAASQLRWQYERFFVVWFVLTFSLAFLLVRKSGSHVHYFLEAVVAASALIVVVLHRAIRELRSRSRRLALVILIFAATLGLAASGYRHHWPIWKHYRWLNEREDPVPAEIRSLIRNTDRPCLLLAKLGTLAIEEHQPAVMDIADFVRLQELGHFDPKRHLYPLFESKTFAVVGVPEFDEDDRASRHFDPRRFPGFIEVFI